MIVFLVINVIIVIIHSSQHQMTCYSCSSQRWGSTGERERRAGDDDGDDHNDHHDHHDHDHDHGHVFQGPYRHYVLNLLWILINLLCLALTIYHLNKLYRYISYCQIKSVAKSM